MGPAVAIDPVPDRAATLDSHSAGNPSALFVNIIFHRGRTPEKKHQNIHKYPLINEQHRLHEHRKLGCKQDTYAFN